MSAMDYEEDASHTRERRLSRKAELDIEGTAASEPRRGPKSCSSHYKGVTKHRRTGRWEAHIWGKSINKGPGKQIYLGGFVTPEEAAEAHDLAALQLQGPQAKTNFHISKYTEWLANLQATPSEENLPLQLRRAGMFKRSSDKVKGPHGEPNTPLTADIKLRLSRASDSTQTAEMEPGNSSAPHFEKEDSISSESSDQNPSGTLRRPVAVRYGHPLQDQDARGGSADLILQGTVALPKSQEGRRGPVLPSRSLGRMGTQNGSGGFTQPRSSGQPMVPLSWKSFEAMGNSQPGASAQHSPCPLRQPSSQLPSTAEGFTRSADDSGAWVNLSANGGIVYGHRNFLGFLTSEQVKFLEASGVVFPEHLRASRAPPPLAPPQEAAPVAEILNGHLPSVTDENYEPPPYVRQASLSEHDMQGMPEISGPGFAPCFVEDSATFPHKPIILPIRPTPLKRSAHGEDQQIAEALLGLRAAKST